MSDETPEVITIFMLRYPAKDKPELVIRVDGKTLVYRMSFDQLLYLSAQASHGVADYPIKSIK